MNPINTYIDHTILKPDSTQSQVVEVCNQAMEYRFASVCILPYYVKLAHETLGDSGVPVCTVIGFPLGAHQTAVKVLEAKQAVQDGAQEIDMVLNVAALKNKDFDLVQNDVAEVVKASAPHLVKVILETCLLTDEEKIKACQLAEAAGAHFVKTSTGFSHGGATEQDIRLMRKTVSNTVKIKASGGIRDFSTAQTMIEAGADRIGASSGVQIMAEYLKTQ